MMSILTRYCYHKRGKFQKFLTKTECAEILFLANSSNDSKTPICSSIYVVNWL